MAFAWEPFDRVQPTHFPNPHLDRTGGYPSELGRILSLAAIAEAREVITAWPGYAPTPLISLAGLAQQLAIAQLSYKDEAGRFGLGSFKALGGAYGVHCAARRALARHGPAGVGAGGNDTAAGRAVERRLGLTVTAATDGNHGRSVAWGARLAGCGAVVFVHERVSASRVRQIEAQGASVLRVPGTYDDAVRAAVEAATAQGWLLVADTSGPELLPAARDVMAGYTVLIDEALRQLGPGQAPTHVLVQAGVGGLAAALLAALWGRFGARRPRLIVVEPERAACLLRSAQAGRPVAIEGALDTVMAGLSCGEPSYPAWQILDRGADGFCVVPDSVVAPAMRLLAQSPFGDPAIIAGESAVAGLALLICACRSTEPGKSLLLTPEARVLVIGTEGATDPELYRSMVDDDSRA